MRDAYAQDPANPSTATGRAPRKPRQACPVQLRSPRVPDAQAIWRLARDSDNTSLHHAHLYLMWCHNFPRTSLITTVDDHVKGFLLGYQRQDHPETLVVWQDTVDPTCEIPELRLRMLNEIVARNASQGVNYLETMVKADDKEPIPILEHFARQYAAQIMRHPLVDADPFPHDHANQLLYKIGPLR